MSANVPAPKNAPAAAPAANAVNAKKNNAPATNANKKNNAPANAANAGKKNNAPANANAGKKNNAPANAANAANAANENAANAPIPRHASVEKIEVSAKGLKELVDKDAKCAELKEQAKKVINDSSAVDEALKKDEVKEPNLKSITNLLKGTIDPIAKACKTNATAAPAAAEMTGGRRRKQKTQKRKAKKSRSKSRRRM